VRDREVIVVCPDKNQDNVRAQKAFEAVGKAYKLLLYQEQKSALDVIQAEKKNTLLRDGALKERKPTDVESDPELCKQTLYKQIMKWFAELHIKRERSQRQMEEGTKWG
jgi:DnaJ family protein C protein 8